MSKTNEQIIIDAYKNILDREPDTSGFNNYLILLEDPNNFLKTQNDLEMILRNSDEGAIVSNTGCVSLTTTLNNLVSNIEQLSKI